jgi:uncharacterized protein (DUF697 family)
MTSFVGRINRVSERDFSGASEEEMRRAVQKVIGVCSTVAGAATLQPVPLLDVALIAPIQITMVRSIGRIRGYSIDMKSAFELFKVFHLGLLTQKAAMSAPAMVPVIGQVLSVWVASALTYAVGVASDHYFCHGRTTPAAELRVVFQSAYRRRRAEAGGSVWRRKSTAAKVEVELSIPPEPPARGTGHPGGS